MAYVNAFWGLVNSTWTTPKVGVLADQCLPSSKSCASLEATVAQLAAKSQRYASDPVAVKSSQILGNFTTQDLKVSSTVLQNRVNVVDQAGSVVETDSEKLLIRIFTLNWKGDHWVVADIKVAA